MSRSTYMAVAAALALVFGLAFLLIPARLLDLYGSGTDEVGLYLARYAGSTYIGIGLIALLARNAPEGPALRAVITGSFVLSAIGLVIAVLDALSGLGNALTWLSVAVYAFLTGGFGYLLFGNSRRSAQSTGSGKSA